MWKHSCSLRWVILTITVNVIAVGDVAKTYSTDLSKQLQPPKRRHTEGKEIKGGREKIIMHKLKEILHAVALWCFKKCNSAMRNAKSSSDAHNKDGSKWHQGARRGQAELAIPKKQLPIVCNSQRRSKCFSSSGRDEKSSEEFRKR